MNEQMTLNFNTVADDLGGEVDDLSKLPPFKLEPVYEFSVFMRLPDGNSFTQSMSTRNAADFYATLFEAASKISDILHMPRTNASYITSESTNIG